MQAGDKAKYEGYEVALFPLDYLYCTQTSSPSSYSHCCGHPADWIGTSYNYPYYAPFSCHRTGVIADGNTRLYTSDNRVWTPKGLTYVTVQFTHDETPPAKTSFKQGELIGHTGIAGQATGDHVHIDQSNIPNANLISYGVICEWGRLCYALDESQYPYDIFYLAGNERIVNTQGMQFEIWNGSPIYHGDKFKWWMARKILERRKYGL